MSRRGRGLLWASCGSAVWSAAVTWGAWHVASRLEWLPGETGMAVALISSALAVLACGAFIVYLTGAYKVGWRKRLVLLCVPSVTAGLASTLVVYWHALQVAHWQPELRGLGKLGEETAIRAAMLLIPALIVAGIWSAVNRRSRATFPEQCRPPLPVDGADGAVPDDESKAPKAKRSRRRWLVLALLLVLGVSWAIVAQAFANREQELGDEVGVSGDLSAAVPHYRVALRWWPFHYRARFALAYCLDHLDQTSEALNEYRTLLRIYPRDARAHYNTGLLLYRQWGQTENLDETYGAVAVLDGSVAKHSFRLLDMAISHLEAATRLRPDAAMVWWKLGVACHWRGALPEGRTALEKATQLEPDSASAWADLGAVLGAQGQWNLAIDAVRKALAIGPETAKTRVNLGLDLAALGRIEEAVDELRKAVQIDPQFRYAYYMWANTVLLAKDRAWLASTIDEFRKMAAAPHAQEPVQTALGLLFLAAQKPDEAEDAFGRALSLSPDSAEAHYGLGRALHAQGRNESAAGELREAVRLAPGFRSAHAALADVLERDPQTREEAEKHRELAHGAKSDFLEELRPRKRGRGRR